MVATVHGTDWPERRHTGLEFTAVLRGHPCARAQRPAVQVSRTTTKGRTTVLAIDILKWPGMNQAFLVSLIVTVVMTLAVVPYAKRRPRNTPFSWGEAMLGSFYAFFVMFLAYGVVPHQWLVHVQNELGWRKDKPLLGPFDLFKPKAIGGRFPFSMNYEQVGDIVASTIYIVFLGMQMWVWKFWQQRGKTPSKEVTVSTYGRPLVKKA
jgi:hypothetical protein